MKLKKSILTICICLTFIIVTAIPVFANTKSWSSRMYLRHVDGKNNGKIYTMTDGDMTNNFNISVISKDKGANSKPNTVTVYVYKNGFFTKNLGGKSIKPSSNIIKEAYKSYGTQPKGDYYLVISKPEDDGWNLKIEGTLITK